ncbi:hypothetical protein J3F83DRAFT_739424 [Trichoderma novae-zelandiae]
MHSLFHAFSLFIWQSSFGGTVAGKLTRPAVLFFLFPSISIFDFPSPSSSSWDPFASAEPPLRLYTHCAQANTQQQRGPPLTVACNSLPAPFDLHLN